MDIRKVFSFISIVVALLLFLTNSPLRAIPPEHVPRFNAIYNTSFEPDSVKFDTSFNSRKNIISVDFLLLFPALGYSRIIPLSKKTGLLFYGSITPYFNFIIDLGGSLTFGKNQHHFEPGGGYLLFADNFYVKTGYRYQGRRGFVFKIAPGYSISKNVVWFTTSFGYAF